MPKLSLNPNLEVSKKYILAISAVLMTFCKIFRGWFIDIGTYIIPLANGAVFAQMAENWIGITKTIHSITTIYD